MKTENKDKQMPWKINTIKILLQKHFSSLVFLFYKSNCKSQTTSSKTQNKIVYTYLRPVILV